MPVELEKCGLTDGPNKREVFVGCGSALMPVPKPTAASLPAPPVSEIERPLPMKCAFLLRHRKLALGRGRTWMDLLSLTL